MFKKHSIVFKAGHVEHNFSITPSLRMLYDFNSYPYLLAFQFDFFYWSVGFCIKRRFIL
jgi:hypothetical protein